MNIEAQVVDKLSAQYAPLHLEVVNESHRHSVPANSETHFKVVLVSCHFDNVRKLARHQMLYKTLEDQIAQGIHALTMHLYTPAEWDQHQGQAPASPECMGGSKKTRSEQ